MEEKKTYARELDNSGNIEGTIEDGHGNWYEGSGSKPLYSPETDEGFETPGKTA
jgi:hypothetical protein